MAIHLLLLVVFSGCCCFMPGFTAISQGGELEKQRPFRLAGCHNVFSNVNEADIQVMLKVWIKTVSKDYDFAMDADPQIVPSTDAIIELSRAQLIDAFIVLTPDILKLQNSMSFDLFAAPVAGGGITEEYVVLVNKNSGVTKISQLKGAELNVWENARMSLGEIWLGSILLEQKLGGMQMFQRITRLNKPSQVALPVFFGKVKACLMTKASYLVMTELNPQIAKQLNVVVSSPPLVPYGFALRADITSHYKQDIIKAIETVDKKEVGRQIMTYLQADCMKVYPISVIDDSLALVKKHGRLDQQMPRRLSRQDGSRLPALRGSQGG